MKMKKSILLLATVFIGITVDAQINTSGRVIYETVRKIEVKLQGDAAQFENMIPKERRSKKELLFNSEISLYKPIVENKDDEVTNDAGGGAVVLRMAEPTTIVFTDLKSKVNLEQREFMSRNFLIETKTDTVQWKMTGKQKEIQGYNCLEAELVGAKRKTVVWFTPMIPISSGPEGLVGLPGLIISADIDDGKATYLAQKIELNEVDPALLVKPTEGKKVTRKEFNRIMDEKMKEMGGQGAQGGARIFISR